MTASPLSPLQHRMFALLWTAALAAQLGAAVQGVGASWLMTALDGTPDKVALVQAALSLPIGLFALAAGAAADLYDRRRVMLCAQLLMLAVSLLLAVLGQAGLVTPWLLLALTFLIGSGNALFGPSMQATVGEVVPRADLPAAISLNILGLNVARSFGPALGGVFVAVGGAPLAFLVNALSYTGMIVVLASWRRAAAADNVRVAAGVAQAAGIGAAVIGGLRHVAAAPVLRTVLLRTVGFGLCGSAAWALMPLVARDIVGGGPLAFGLLLGGLGCGAVIGALANASLRRRFSNEVLVRAASVVYGLGSIVVAFSPSLPLSFVALVMGGAGWVQALSTFNVTMQLWSPRWVVGRALATFQMAIFGSMALGSWLWGRVAEDVALATALAGSGLLMLLLPLLGRYLALPQHEEASRQAAN